VTLVAAGAVHTQPAAAPSACSLATPHPTITHHAWPRHWVPSTLLLAPMSCRAACSPHPAYTRSPIPIPTPCPHRSSQHRAISPHAVVHPSLTLPSPLTPLPPRALPPAHPCPDGPALSSCSPCPDTSVAPTQSPLFCSRHWNRGPREQLQDAPVHCAHGCCAWVEHPVEDGSC
jgi:hypothetical protein